MAEQRTSSKEICGPHDNIRLYMNENRRKYLQLTDMLAALCFLQIFPTLKHGKETTTWCRKDSKKECFVISKHLRAKFKFLKGTL